MSTTNRSVPASTVLNDRKILSADYREKQLKMHKLEVFEK